MACMYGVYMVYVWHIGVCVACMCGVCTLVARMLKYMHKKLGVYFCCCLQEKLHFIMRHILI